MDNQEAQKAKKGTVPARTGPRVVPKEAPPAGSLTSLKLAGGAVVVIVAIVVAWSALHLVFAVLRILELVAVALVFGYVGWLAGVYHGRRTARRG
jgi:hypothetical protein